MSHINAFHLDYIAALRAEGHEVKIMAKGEGADYDIPFEKRIISKSNNKIRPQIRRIVKSEKFDLIILNTSLAALHIRLAARGKSRPRIVNIVHGYLFPLMPRSLKERIKAAMLLMAEKVTRSSTDAILTMNSEDYVIATKNKLCAPGGCIVNTLGMGVKRAEITVSREDLRRDLGADGAFVMLFVGELSGRKNQEYLIRNLVKIKEAHKEAQLWLIGEGGERERLEALAAELGVSESVKLLGRREDPANYMNAADVYVSAAKSEGLPFNIVEAVGAGCTVIASDVKGQRDILGDGGGILYSLSEPYGLAEAVNAMASAEGVTAKAKEAAYLRFSYDRVFADTYGKIKEAGGL